MIRKLLITLSLVLSLSAVLVPATAYGYDPFGGVCSGDQAKGSSLCQGQGDSSQNPLTGPKGLIRGIANILAIVSGLAAVIMIIIAGFRYITSGGEAAKTKEAKEMITGAIVGLLILTLASAFISFIIGRV